MSVGTKQSYQFQGTFDVVPFKATVDFASAATGSFVSSDIAVAGAELGDLVVVSVGVDTVDAVIVAAVTAADVVTATLVNVTGGAVDLASTTVTGAVLKPKGVYSEL